MSQFIGKTAVISGGADGIGKSLAKALGQEGMNIVIADIEKQPLAEAEQELTGLGVSVLAIEMDVARKSDWERTAKAARERFGDIHMLINNAGVSGGVGSVETLDEASWRWLIDVNLMGVVYGANVFVPLLREHGEPSWLINVASMAGMCGVPLGGAYTATKAAVVALSEAWAQELKDQAVQVSVLAPAFVRTRIHQCNRNRQRRYASHIEPSADVVKVADATTQAVKNGIDVNIVGQRFIEALEAGEFYIFTHPNYQPVTDRRSAAIAEAFQRASDSPFLKDIKQQNVLNFGGQ